MNIVIVDDHPLVRQGLAMVISSENDMNLVAEAANANEALKKIASNKPDIAILDLRLSDKSGLDVLKHCKEQAPDCKYIILTSSDNPEDFRRAHEIGVEGYLLKTAFPEELIAAIRIVYRGRKYYDSGMVEFVINKDGCDSPLELLTPRELEVLKAIGEGLNNKEIAQKLFISEYTVKKHVSQVFMKLGFTDRIHAALFAVEKKITA